SPAAARRRASLRRARSPDRDPNRSAASAERRPAFLNKSEPLTRARIGASKKEVHMTQATLAKAQAAPASPDLAALKTRQQASWSSGDYAIVGTTLQIVGEDLCEALDVRSGQKVLDVAAGNGNVSLAAARRFCNVVATDYVPALLERARERAHAERLPIEFQEADAEALPFEDASFDVVVSTFGVMFTADHDRAASE